MKRFILLISLITGMGAVLFAQQLTVAVRVFETSGGLSQDEGNAITDIFVSELVSTGKVRVVDRSSFEAIIAEMKFGASSWSDNNNVARLGKAINASYIIQGTVTSLGGRIIITVRVLDINTVQFVSSPNLQLSKMDEIFAKLTPFVRDLALNLTDNSTVYQVGSVGPSGGYVFFDKGSYSDGWRYLEAAPASAEFKARLSDAVERCKALNVNGFTGWRLPNKDELNFMYGYLKQANLGDFGNNSYLSSSWEGHYNYRTNSVTDYLCIQYFGDGNQHSYGNDRSTVGAVRAIRQF